MGGGRGLNGCAFTYADARDTPPLQRFGETKARRAPGQGGQRTGGVSSCGSEQGSGARRGSQAYPAISARNERQIFVASVFPAPLSPAQHTGSVGQLSAACGSLRGRAFHAPLITMDWLCFFASICSYAALVTWYACGGKAPAS